MWGCWTSTTDDLGKQVRDYPFNITGLNQKEVCLSWKTWLQAPTMGTNCPWPHFTPNVIRGCVVDYIMFPFSADRSAPHCPPCKKPAQVALEHWTPWSHDLRSGFWYLDLAVGGSENGAFNLHFWVLYGDENQGRAPQRYESLLLVRQEFLNLWGLKSTYRE
jgi:hypothetical protein